MTYRDILLKAEKILCNSGIDEAKNDAWLLFEYVFKMARHEYFMKMNDTITDNICLNDKYIKCVERRASHVPLQYITGCQEFMGYNFSVNESVLIPRQDTEILVERALEALKSMNVSEVNFLDMCTGSGCIAISLYLKAVQHGIKSVKCTAVDISKEALLVAKNNAIANGAGNIEFVHSNLFEQFGKNSDCGNRIKYDMIVSNPPYIRSKDIEGLMPEVKNYEPRMALDGTEDGLLFYRTITEESVRYIKEGGILLYEIGCDQGEDVKNIMEQNGYKCVSVIKDLAGLDRIVSGKRSYE